MASDYSAARQEFVDRINAGVSLAIPFIQKRVNLGKKSLNEDARTHGIITLYVPAGGTGGVEELTNATYNGPVPTALDRTADFAAGKGSASYYEVKCYSHNAWEVYAHKVLEKMFMTGNLDKNVIQGRINHMVQSINKDLVSRNAYRAGGATVAGSTELGFVAMDKAISLLQTIKVEGGWTGYISPLFKSKLRTTSALKNGGFDVPDEALKDMYGRGGIGVFGGADWVNEAFMPEYTSGVLNTTTTSGTGVKVKTAVSTQGATQITLKGVTASGSIPKGTPFTIEGVYDVTIAGISIMEQKVFITQKDATADGSGDVTLDVLPIYFNDDTKGYQNNVYVSGSAIPENAVVKSPVEAASTYFVGLIKEDESFNWTPFELEEVDGCKNTTSSTEDITVQLVSGGNLEKRDNKMRFDASYFGDIVDPRANRLVYYKK